MQTGNLLAHPNYFPDPLMEKPEKLKNWVREEFPLIFQFANIFSHSALTRLIVNHTRFNNTYTAPVPPSLARAEQKARTSFF